MAYHDCDDHDDICSECQFVIGRDGKGMTVFTLGSYEIKRGQSPSLDADIPEGHLVAGDKER